MCQVLPLSTADFQRMWGGSLSPAGWLCQAEAPVASRLIGSGLLAHITVSLALAFMLKSSSWLAGSQGNPLGEGCPVFSLMVGTNMWPWGMAGKDAALSSSGGIP